MRITSLFLPSGAIVPVFPKRNDATLAPVGLWIWLHLQHRNMVPPRTANDNRRKISPAELPSVDRGQYEFSRLRNQGDDLAGPA